MRDFYNYSSFFLGRQRLRRFLMLSSRFLIVRLEEGSIVYDILMAFFIEIHVCFPVYYGQIFQIGGMKDGKN